MILNEHPPPPPLPKYKSFLRQWSMYSSEKNSQYVLYTHVGGYQGYDHSVPGRIAVNMIICCASGGTLAVIIASWAQVCSLDVCTHNTNDVWSEKCCGVVSFR